MAKLIWDAVDQRLFELGVDHGVLFLMESAGKYKSGVVWNGLTGVTESPEGAELTDLWADNIKYASLRSAENWKGTIEAYMYPPEFDACNGYGALGGADSGVTIGQQDRVGFAFSYRTKVGNGTLAEGDDHYKIHIVYGCTASPSEAAYTTVNDSPDAITFSWEIDSTPVPVTGAKPSSTVVIDSSKVSAEVLKQIEDKLYGSESEEPTLLMPDEIAELIKAA